MRSKWTINEKEQMYLLLDDSTRENAETIVICKPIASRRLRTAIHSAEEILMPPQKIYKGKVAVGVEYRLRDSGDSNLIRTEDLWISAMEHLYQNNYIDLIMRTCLIMNLSFGE